MELLQYIKYSRMTQNQYEINSRKMGKEFVKSQRKRILEESLKQIDMQNESKAGQAVNVDEIDSKIVVTATTMQTSLKQIDAWRRSYKGYSDFNPDAKPLITLGDLITVYQQYRKSGKLV